MAQPTSNRRVRVAAYQFKIRPAAHFEAFAAHAESAVREAASKGVQLLLLPEYFSAELLSLVDPALSLTAQIRALAAFEPQFRDLFTRLAREHGLHVVAGTLPTFVQGSKEKLHNDALLFAPTGAVAVQSKLFMTRFEDERWLISGGEELKVFDLGFVRFAVLTCYDAEFPELGRRAAKAGAELLLVPSCTETRQGWFRVRGCAAARAIENQVYVVHCGVAGALDNFEAVAANYALSSVLTPSDAGFPRDGVLAELAENEEALLVADLDLDAIARVRADGSVFTYKDGLTAETRAPVAQLLRLE
jgi:predicted amidohydrolase